MLNTNKNLLFLGVPIKPLQKHSLQRGSISEYQKTNAEYAVDHSAKVIEIDVCEIFYFELNGRRYKYLVLFFIDIKDSKTFFHI